MNWVPIGACDSHIHICGSGMPPAYGLNNDCALVAITALGRDSTRETAVIDGAPEPVENWGTPSTTASVIQAPERSLAWIGSF